MTTWSPVHVAFCHLVIKATEGETEVSTRPEMTEKSHGSETGINTSLSCFTFWDNGGET